MKNRKTNQPQDSEFLQPSIKVSETFSFMRISLTHSCRRHVHCLVYSEIKVSSLLNLLLPLSHFVISVIQVTWATQVASLSPAQPFLDPSKIVMKMFRLRTPRVRHTNRFCLSDNFFSDHFTRQRNKKNNFQCEMIVSVKQKVPKIPHSSPQKITIQRFSFEIIDWMQFLSKDHGVIQRRLKCYK